MPNDNLGGHRLDDELGASMTQAAKRQGLDTISFQRDRFFAETVQRAARPRPRLSRLGWWLGAATVLALMLGVTAVWRDAAQAGAVSRQAQAELTRLPPASALLDSLSVNGQKDGFHSTMVASILLPPSLAGDSRLTGYWVVTYVGSHPPAIAQYSLTGTGWAGSDLPITSGGSGHTWTPIQVGPDRYLYWIVRWNRSVSLGEPPATAYRMLQASQLKLTFTDGGRVVLASHLAQRAPADFNSPYCLAQNPYSIQPAKPPSVIYAEVSVASPGFLVLQYRADQLITVQVNAETTTWRNGRYVSYDSAPPVALGEFVAVETQPADQASHGEVVARTIYGNMSALQVRGVVSHVSGGIVTVNDVQLLADGRLRSTGHTTAFVYNTETNFFGASPAALQPGTLVWATTVGDGTLRLAQDITVLHRAGPSAPWHMMAQQPAVPH